MTFCNNCGSSIPEGATFCQNCGQAVQPEAVPYQNPVQPDFSQQPVYVQQPPYAPAEQPQFNREPQYTQPQPPVGKMPSAGLHLAFVIIGFLLGILWGALSIGPYHKMKDAIAAGDSITANAQAKKVRTFFIIGLVLNVLFVIGRTAAGI